MNTKNITKTLAKVVANETKTATGEKYKTLKVADVAKDKVIHISGLSL